jgi:thiol-disulfide isomerase/thioredoxin
MRTQVRAHTVASAFDAGLLPRLLAWSLPLILLLFAGCAPPQGSGDGAAAARSGAPAPAEAGVDEILERVRDSGAKAVLVNVWATWCAPCREEFPDLMRLRRSQDDGDFDLVLVSADFDTPLEEIRGFLTEQGVDFPSYLKSGSDMRFIETLDPNWSGALPASFLYDAEGVRRHTWVGKVTYDELAEQVRRLTGGGPIAERR